VDILQCVTNIVRVLVERKLGTHHIDIGRVKRVRGWAVFEESQLKGFRFGTNGMPLGPSGMPPEIVARETRFWHSCTTPKNLKFGDDELQCVTNNFRVLVERRF